MDTIMAPLTPVAFSAVIVVRISGHIDSIKHFFDICFEDLKPNTVKVAGFKSTVNEKIQDQVILTYFAAPKSYTGEDVLEVSFHGNPLIVNTAMQDFANAGVRMAEEGEFSKRAYLNGKMSLSQASSVNSMIMAHTDNGVKAASLNLSGALDKSFYKLREALIDLSAEVEASIDFAEELYELKDSGNGNVLNAVIDSLKDLLDKYADAQKALNGVQIVITGAVNAGKSTLFNLLLGKDRAIVSEEEGTTRDTLSEQIHLGGVQVILTDSAGFRQSDSAAETEGMRRALASIEDADIVLLLIDKSREAPESAKQLAVKAKDKAVLIGTKSDLPAVNLEKVDCHVSAKDPETVALLKQQLSARVSEILNLDFQSPVLLSEVQYLECRQCLTELQNINSDMPLDIRAFHLRQAIESLDRAQGSGVSEEVLDVVFSRFCVGK